ncbi:polysaccharide biosynthesis protein [Geomonas sp. Red276]
MSRIDIAMEKAAFLRQGLPPEPAAPAPHEERRPSPPPPTAPLFPVADRRLTPRNPFLVALKDPQSPVAEEYRKLKSTLVKMTKGEQFRNTLAVTSSLPNEGKSLTALNLAISLAQEIDHTVLLIDADLRRPSVHRYLEIENGPGLGDVLLGEAEIGDTIVPTGIGKLSIMRAGKKADNPGELFSSHRMKEVVGEMKNRYGERYLIFDTPPVLPFAETRSLARLMDGLLFVVMERLAAESSIKEALASLKGCPVMGVVYNAAAMWSLDEPYSYYRKYKPAPAPRVKK